MYSPVLVMRDVFFRFKQYRRKKDREHARCSRVFRTYLAMGVLLSFTFLKPSLDCWLTKVYKNFFSIVEKLQAEFAER